MKLLLKLIIEIEDIKLFSVPSWLVEWTNGQILRMR
jgi:hypothetical protein